MKVRAMMSCALPVLLFAGPPAAGQTSGLPPGLARADKPEQVAALYDEGRKQRLQAMREAARQAQSHPLEDHTRQLAAYRTALVEEQRLRRLRELEVEREHEARLRAQELAARAELEKSRQDRVLHLHAIQAYHHWLRHEGAWMRAYRQHHRPLPCHQPQPCTARADKTPLASTAP